MDKLEKKEAERPQCKHDYEIKDMSYLTAVFGGGSRKDRHECKKCDDVYYY